MTTKKMLSVILSICMIISMLMVPVAAEGANIDMVTDKTECAIGDTVTVVISNTDMNMQGFGLYMEFDKEIVECTEILGVDGDEYLGLYSQGKKGASWVEPSVADDVENTNKDGIFSFGVLGATTGTNFLEGDIATLKFTAKAAGTVTFALTEESTGTDGYKDLVKKIEVTVAAAEPECEHTDADLTKVPAKTPNCGETGNNEYYTCACGKVFKADKTTETTVEDETLPVDKDNHVGETEIRNESETYTGDTYCLTCGNLIATGEEIPGGTTGGGTTGGGTTGGGTTGGGTTGGGTTGGGTTGGGTTGGGTTGGDTSTGGNTSVITPVGPAPEEDDEPTTFKYIDVDGHWCEDLIYKWTEKGVIEGVGGNKFNPDGLLTRAQAAAIFTRWLDLEATTDISFFTDVKVGDWYYDYVAKCYAAGIVKGKAADQFAPNDYITRAEMFTMLCRALNIDGQTTISKVFTDIDQVPAWAAEYTYALINNGYVSGMTETTLAPLGNLTRAQMVKLMDNLEGLVK